MVGRVLDFNVCVQNAESNWKDNKSSRHGLYLNFDSSQFGLRSCLLETFMPVSMPVSYHDVA